MQWMHLSEFEMNCCVIQCDVVHFTANKPAIECALYVAFVVLSGLALFWFPAEDDILFLIVVVVDHFYNVALFSVLKQTHRALVT